MRRIMLCLGFTVVTGMVAGCSTFSPSNTASRDNSVPANPPHPVTTSVGNSTNSNPPNTPVPAWFLDDLKIASKVHFPVTGESYLLNLNYPYNDSSTWSKPPQRTDFQKVWIGSYTGRMTLQGYTVYSGTMNMRNLYQHAMSADVQWLGSVTPIYMLESQSDINGEFASGDNGGLLMPAGAVDLGNGLSLAFAKNQVILKSNHAGAYQYTVIPVQGITVP